ncbi:aldehyde dehydrogenase family protein [Microbacterium sediminicola]|uniref:Aldehyde dehydrogenase family protein n=1 Tax=Microbacterium sediminicola TaxID=415210 RepID=A0ABP4ULP4_9MICO
MTTTTATDAGAPTDRAGLDAALRELGAGEKRWAKMPLAVRATLLRRTHASIARTAPQWAMAAGRIKGLDPASPLMGEEWITGPYAAMITVAQLADTLADLAARRSPLARAKFGAAPGKRVTVRVMPSSAYESVLLHGFRADVWLRPGVAASTARTRAGLAQLHPHRTQGVALVLGAGNITSIALLDAVYELIAHNRVVLLKLNPVMDEMFSVLQPALAPLIEAGVLRIVRGGAEAGAYLTQHPDIAHIHITGSARTHDAIVYGPGEDGHARKAAGTPILTKPITSELGGVSPVIVVPGAWTREDLRYQAEHIATMRLHNGGFNCIAGQLVIVSRDWALKDAFLAQLRHALDRAPARLAWYPGADERVASASATYPDATRVGESGERLLVGIGDGADATPLQSTEYFAPVLGVREVAGTGQEFLDAAVDLANNELDGTLGANILISPRERRTLGAGFETALAALRYGTIGINAWTGVGFNTAAVPWGAFPGHTLDDIQSGLGVVHNALLIDATERTVVTGPFRPFPRSLAHGHFALFPLPPWFVTNRRAAETGRLLAAYAVRPSWRRILRVFLSAVRA